MANQTEIDKAAIAVSTIIDKAKIQVTDDIYAILSKLDNATMIEALKGLDVATILNNKVAKGLGAYTIAHRKVLESTIGFQGVNASVLTSLIELNQDILNQSVIRTTASQIKSKIASGIIAGTKPAQIVQQITNASISTAQVETLVTTSLNTYGRVITNQMMNEAPKSTKYVYIGPVDDATRDDCLDMASAGALTQDQIISQFGEAVLSDGGGFNCRHKWEIASEEGTRFHEPEAAKDKLEKN